MSHQRRGTPNSEETTSYYRETATSTKPKSTDLDDDWETDPDYERNFGEEHQRWGAQRTVGAVNMEELIDRVQKEHQKQRQEFMHSSQRDRAHRLASEMGKKPTSSNHEDYERLEKTAYEKSEKVIKRTTMTSSSSGGSLIDEAKRQFFKSDKDEKETDGLPSASTSAYSFQSKSTKQSPSDRIGEFSATNRREYFEEKSSSSTATSPTSKTKEGESSSSAALKSIQDKIDEFKKEFENVRNEIEKKSELSKIVKKSTETKREVVKGENSIKSLTKKFEHLYQESRNSKFPDKMDNKREEYTRREEHTDIANSPDEIRSKFEKFGNLKRN